MVNWTAEFFRAQDNAGKSGFSQDRAFCRVWCAREDGNTEFTGGAVLGDPAMHIVKGWVIDGRKDEVWWKKIPTDDVHPLKPDNSPYGLIARYQLKKARERYGQEATVVNMPINNIWTMTLLIPEGKILESQATIPLLPSDISLE